MTQMNLPYKFAIPIVILFAFLMWYNPAVCFIILGGGTLIGGIYTCFVVSKIIKNGIQGIGKILSYESDSDGYKTPKVQFYTQEGNEVIRKPWFYASTDLSKLRSYKRKLNKEVEIIYDPKNPKKFLIQSERAFNYFALSFLFIVAIVFLVIGILGATGTIDFNF